MCFPIFPEHNETYFLLLSLVLLTRFILESRICTMPAGYRLWRPLNMTAPSPPIDDSKTCFHGMEWENCFSGRPRLPYGCKWWHFVPSTSDTYLMNKYQEISKMPKAWIKDETVTHSQKNQSFSDSQSCWCCYLIWCLKLRFLTICAQIATPWSIHLSFSTFHLELTKYTHLTFKRQKEMLSLNDNKLSH